MNADFFLDWAGLAVSLFNTISLLWLGLTVLLNSDRRTVSTWLTGGGMLLGALLFTSHTAILGRGLANTSFGMDFWWWISWGPAIAAPLAWYGAMLWYSGFQLGRTHPHRPWLIANVGLATAIVLLLILANPLPSYDHVAHRGLVPTPTVAGIPLLILLYLVYSILCYLLPLDLLRRAEAAARPLAAAARRRARPWLTAVSVFWLLAGVVMVWTALWALRAEPAPTLADPAVARTAKRFDLVISELIAMAVTLLGRAIVGYAVFTGRPLPRHGFFRQWRSTVILAAGYSTVIAWTLAIGLRPLYCLMLATAIMVLFYALYSWRAFAERDQFMAQLRPFVASQDLYDQLLSATPPDNAAPQLLFDTLCRDVLGARAAVLVPTGALATLAGPPLVYAPAGTRTTVPPAAELTARFPSPQTRYLSAADTGAAWAVSLWNERGLGGVLLLEEKANGNPYTEEEIEIAQAGGERLLDSLAGVEMARVAMQLLGQRIAQVKVMGAQGRRVLHDQVLPQLHSAVLYLGELQGTPAAQQAVETLTAAHHQISDLIRDTPPTATHQLARQGLIQALQDVVEKEFAGAFDQATWRSTAASTQAAGRLPLFVREVVHFAALELIRNAARHGRGQEKEHPLHLTVSLELDERLSLRIEDDGVGFAPEGGPPAGDRQGEGSGCGLRFHSTMLAAVGAGLEVQSLPEGGTRGIITLPSQKEGP